MSTTSPNLEFDFGRHVEASLEAHVHGGGDALAHAPTLEVIHLFGSERHVGAGSGAHCCRSSGATDQTGLLPARRHQVSAHAQTSVSHVCGSTKHLSRRKGALLSPGGG